MQEGERVGFLNFTGSFQSFLHLIVLLAYATFHLLIFINDGFIIVVLVIIFITVLCSFSLIVVVAIGVTIVVVIIIVVVDCC